MDIEARTMTPNNPPSLIKGRSPSQNSIQSHTNSNNINDPFQKQVEEKPPEETLAMKFRKSFVPIKKDLVFQNIIS